MHDDLTNRARTLVCLILLTTALAGKLSGQSQPAMVIHNSETATLSNGSVSLTIKKSNGTISSLKYRDREVMGRGGGYWVMLGAVPGAQTIQMAGAPSDFSVTKDPAKDGGTIAEVAVRFPYRGQAGTIPLDIELRYALHPGDPAIYASATFDHAPEYPPFDVEVGVLTLKLNSEVFDFLSVDSARQKLMPTPAEWVAGTQMNVKEARMIHSGPNAGKVEHKYDYNTLTWRTPAYGWSSTKEKMGVFIVNPSIEYINGGPVHVDYEGHIDVKPALPADPTLLFNWHSSHYGGQKIQLNSNERWRKTVGPILIYCNEGANTHEMWQNALSRAAKEKQSWPYEWVNVPGYEHAAARGTASGRLQVNDPQAPVSGAGGAWVGLAHEPYRVVLRNMNTTFDWQLDGKYYQYWTQADSSGNFTIPNARPGTYTLYAFKDDILGEFSRPDITITAGKQLSLGNLKWIPHRNGKQLWEIGVPNRSAKEFRHGDHYWQWGLYNLYPQEFPNDVDFTIGKSKYQRDWNYAQPGKPDGKGGYNNTTWKVRFTMDQQVKGTAMLRLAICGARGGPVDVSLNGRPIGSTGSLLQSGVMHRDGIRSAALTVCDLKFDAAMLIPGNNIVELTKHARDWPDGVLYDYIRMEVDEGKVYK